MKIHFLQHASFEGPANMAVWATARGHTLAQTSLFLSERLPETGEFDWLLIMGGPMNVYEEREFPWLPAEKRLIEQAIAKGKIVLGVCLGAQLIADVLGARVYKNAYKEIGWHPVSLTAEAKESSSFRVLPDKFVAFHWHGDTFDLPSGCTRLAKSEGCLNQAFEYGDRVVGLQFHLESSLESIQLLVQNCSEELVAGKYIQTADQILSSNGRLQELRRIQALFLGKLEGSCASE